MVIRARRLQNTFYDIYDSKGNWLKGVEAVSNAILEYYKSLLATALENWVK